LCRENERLRREVERLGGEVAERDRRIAEGEKRIAELERELARARLNSTNSSKPPSSDGLAGQSRPRGRPCGRRKGRRKAGGQPGHAGHHRPMVEPERVDRVVAVVPERCGHCGHGLSAPPEQAGSAGDVHRHQVFEVPAVRALVTEHQCHRLACPACGKSTRAEIPPEARRQTGARLTALVAHLTVCCRMPRRVLRDVLEQALGIRLGLGTIQSCWEQASEAVAGPCGELERRLCREPWLSIDETGWRTNGAKRFLWAFAAAQYAVYVVARTRGSELLVRVLGAVFEGILCSDRFSGYLKYHKGRAQFCWAHLKRNILGVLEFTKRTGTERFCRDALAQHARLFRLWRRFQGGGMDRGELAVRSIPIQKRLLALAGAHLDDADRQVANLARALFEHSGRLFTFLEAAGVEPTNNRAERTLRTGVQWRKICFGNRSAAGELATARLLTVSETCRIQNRNKLDYLAEAIANHRKGLPVQSLFPTA